MVSRYLARLGILSALAFFCLLHVQYRRIPFIAQETAIQ